MMISAISEHPTYITANAIIDSPKVCGESNDLIGSQY